MSKKNNRIMQETLITFKTAKLAKEKGFNIPTVEYFNNEKKPRITSSCDYRSDRDAISNWNNGEGSYPTLSKDVSCSAPKQSLLQKWLREQSTPIIVTPTTDLVAWEVEILHADKGLFRIIKNIEDKWFNSYEEALEIGLQEALKLI
jgi:hypothetical protein